MPDIFDHEFPEAMVEATARALRPDDFWQARAEYPTRSRVDYEAGQKFARWEAAEALNRLAAAGYILMPTGPLNEALGMVNFGGYPSDVEALIAWIGNQPEPSPSGDGRG